MASIKEIINNLTQEEKEEFKQYATSIKEIKKKMSEMINKSKTSIKEIGGNMSSGLVLTSEEE
jgi:coenzyme F420-reducing hydrogenase delta subunit